MKNKNGILLLIVVLLGVFTYVFEEVGEKERRESEDKKISLFDPKSLGEMTSFSNKNVTINFSGTKAFIQDGNDLVDRDNLNNIFSILSQIKFTKVVAKGIEADVSKYVDIKNDPFVEFSFSKGKLKFILGKKLEFDQSFYLLVEKENERTVVVAYDSTPLEGMYKKETHHKTDEKYRLLKSALLVKKEFLQDRRVFPHLFYSKNHKSFKKIKIENYRNKSFELDYVNKTTIPKVPVGITNSKESFEQFQLFLSRLQGERFFKNIEKSELKDLKSYILLDNSLELELYNSFRSENGNYLYLPSQKKVFTIRTQDKLPFFSSVQSFWNKSLKLPRKKINVWLALEGSKKNFNVDQTKGMKVFEVGGSEANHFNFNLLFKLLGSEPQYVKDEEVPNHKFKLLDLGWDENSYSIFKNREGYTVSDNRSGIIRFYGQKKLFNIKWKNFTN